jgi:hypothetical protein
LLRPCLAYSLKIFNSYLNDHTGSTCLALHYWRVVENDPGQIHGLFCPGCKAGSPLACVDGDYIDPLYTAWISQRIDSSVRATVLSLSSQVDAFGQIMGGPGVGWVVR